MGNRPTSIDEVHEDLYLESSSNSLLNDNSHSDTADTVIQLEESDEVIPQNNQNHNGAIDDDTLNHLLGQAGFFNDIITYNENHNVRRLVNSFEDEMFGLEMDDGELAMDSDPDVLDVLEHVSFPVNLNGDKLKVVISEDNSVHLIGILDAVESCEVEIKIGEQKSKKLRFQSGIDQELDYDTGLELEDKEIPVLIMVSTSDKSQITSCTLFVNTDGGYITVDKQVITMEGEAYNTYEIYGMSSTKEETEECVICLTEQRDTIVIPCRHFCVCHGCAEVLKYQSNKCPICRAQTSTMVQILSDSKQQNSTDSLVM
eukprot:TRINITY_DN3311_c0_g1_i1.p1 TRINITY_DN3311_c0_g1~~TRINITY_DN3311_c0_g1_i1.p1  ORF type:complete len:315 (-),score=60.71 TRINITY_DN3311_c0_g1_i1:50-994(-)